MNPSTLPELKERKRSIRHQALERRRSQVHREEASRHIFAAIAKLPEYVTAHTMLFYVDVRDEVQTLPAMTILLAQQRRIAVPYVQGSELQLFHLKSLDELGPGKYGITEPKLAIREDASRHIQPCDLDLVIVPGVAFDRCGRRLGYGKGYFDRLLPNVRPGTSLFAPAFECQLFDEIPVEDHDIPMTKVITEIATYPSP